MLSIRNFTIAVSALASSGCLVVPGYSVTSLSPPIQGRFYDNVSQAPIPDATVQLHLDEEVRQVAMTDADGRFQIEPVRQRHWATVYGLLKVPTRIPHGDVMFQAGRANVVVKHPRYRVSTRSFNFRTDWTSDEWAQEPRTIEVGLDQQGEFVADLLSTSDSHLNLDP